MSDLEQVRALARAALASLERSRQRIDDLNVYPVPDGDTGTNLTLTVRALVEALEASNAGDRATLVREVTRAALMGARGNSGVILSQIVRGAAEGLGETDEVDAATIARALRAASDAAYRAVRRPVEGTMLTVVRALAEEAEGRAAAGPPVPEVLVDLVRRGDEAVAQTQDQLDVLRDAGVVDAGGAGLIEIVRGIAASVSGEELPEAPPTEELAVEAIHQELSRYRYCTVFVLEGDDLDADALERELEPLGDSLLVVGDRSALKVHVHTDDPGAALSAGAAQGVLEGVEIANMHRQTERREERLLEAVENATDVVAVVAGDGNRAIFESLGAARVVEGGQTMNPSTQDMLQAVDAVPYGEVILLPNNKNVVSTAEQAAALATKPARVVPTRSVQAGVAATVRFVPSRPAIDNEEDMLETLADARTGEVTIASRDATVDSVTVRKGAYLGLVEDKAVASGEELHAVALEVVGHLLDGGRSSLSILVGADAPPVERLLAEVRRDHPDVDVEHYEGGQPHYPLLLVAE
jgi:DAK2 domain fusion protein YloV